MYKKILRNLYNFIPFKRFIFLNLKRMGWRPGVSIYQHLHFCGEFSVRVGGSSEFQMVHHGHQMENELFWGGEAGSCEKTSLSLWGALCKDAKVVFDVGANTGIYSLATKAINPNAAVFSFEPIPRIYKKLRKNCQINHFDIVCLEQAASNMDGEADIYDYPYEHAYSASINEDFKLSSDAFAVKIAVCKLDTFVAENRIPVVDLIKIDVETHEPEVLEGFANSLHQFKPVFLIEVLNKEVAQKLNVLLSGCDYQFFNIDDENNTVRQTAEIIPSDKFNYLVCSESCSTQLKNNPMLQEIRWS